MDFLVRQHFYKFLTYIEEGKVDRAQVINICDNKLTLTDFIQFFSGTSTLMGMKTGRLSINFVYSNENEPFLSSDTSRCPSVHTCTRTVTFPIFDIFVVYNRFEKYMSQLMLIDTFDFA